MKREDLKKLELSDEVVDAIMKLHGTDIETHKTQLTTATAELENLKKQIADVNAVIEGFKKLDVDGIKAAADEWKTKAEQAQAEAAQQISGLKFDHALESALSGAKAKNVKAVRALLNTEQLKLQDDGSIFGLEEQLKKVKESNDYLFDGDQPTPKIITGGNNRPIVGDPVILAARKAAGLPVEGEK
jgi:molybdopterin-guanine dinucleotide biosynthesis protein